MQVSEIGVFFGHNAVVSESNISTLRMASELPTTRTEWRGTSADRQVVVSATIDGLASCSKRWHKSGSRPRAVRSYKSKELRSVFKRSPN